MSNFNVSLSDLGLKDSDLYFESTEDNFTIKAELIQDRLFRIILNGFLDFEANLYYTAIIEHILLAYKNYNPSAKIYFIEHASQISGFSFDARTYTEKKIVSWDNLGGFRVLDANHLYQSYIGMIKNALPSCDIQFITNEKEVIEQFRPKVKEVQPKTQNTSSKITVNPPNSLFELLWQKKQEYLKVGGTKVKKISDPEWQFTGSKNHFTANFTILEASFIYAEVIGYVELVDLSRFLGFVKNFIDFLEYQEKQFNLIVDLQSIHGISPKAKNILKRVLLNPEIKPKYLILLNTPNGITGTIKVLNTLFPEKLNYCHFKNSLDDLFKEYFFQDLQESSRNVVSVENQEILLKKEKQIQKLNKQLEESKNLHSHRISQLESVVTELGDPNLVQSDENIEIPDSDPYFNVFSALFKLKEYYKNNTPESDEKSHLWRSQLDNLREIINLANEGIIVVDHGKIEFSNLYFTQFLKITKKELIGRDISDYLVESTGKKLIKDAYAEIDNGRFVSKTTTLKFGNREGNEKKFRVKLSSIVYNQKLCTLFFVKEETSSANKQVQASEADRNRLASLEQKLYESEQLKNTFLANISHELRTPITAILGLADFLSNPELSEASDEYIKLIKLNAANLLQLINNLIDISKIESNQIIAVYNDFNLRTMLKELHQEYCDFKDYHHKNRIEFSNENSISPDFIIHSDEIRLKQIISFLLNNAFKFTEEGKIEFGLASRENGFIKLFVKDSGIGIDEPLKKSIFEQFKQGQEVYTKEFSGIGLGLTIAKRLSQLLGGRIYFESNKGEGSTFFIEIPEAQSSPLKKKETKEEELVESHLSSLSPLLKDKTILIVEDIESGYWLLESMLKKLGAQILWARNGQEAVDTCASSTIDLILMDIRMPVMDGIDATIKIKKFNPSIPILAQTAYAQEEERDRFIEAGCNDYISKPIEQDELFLKIKDLLKENIQFGNPN